jgi:hypothetical protein
MHQSTGVWRNVALLRNRLQGIQHLICLQDAPCPREEIPREREPPCCWHHR